MDDIAPPSPRLDVRDLRVVLALASAGTTARAAAALHLTQPAVSRALLAAEERLGTRLFDRTPRGLVPTPAGQELVAGATRLLVELGDLEHRVRAPVAPAIRLRLVCECYTAYHWLPSALVTLRKSLPGLHLALAVEHTQDPVAALVAGELDVALLTTSTVPRAGLESRPLFSDEIIFVVAASHPLASRRALTREDLREHTLLTGQTPAAESHWFMTQVFGRERPRLRVERLPLTEALLDVARAGLGVAVLSEWITTPHLGKGDLVVKRLASGPLRRPWRMAWRKEVGDAALRLHAALEPTVPRGLAVV
ncbi:MULTISPECIES: LysR family transcriptional regulator [unclassified Corallococcus]|uniref:LysR family transcriptional regulator n=1 Tax=unclassified Corallococcus TaxID=2685029 RepID=UPI001A8F8845|nr:MULTISPECIES: LysR family transcriptional regulator [unclassified Corallococcus]MBN9685944.1 LysR family transcriptional regulator [Corallococcus sp. NCSPR001]WAS82616.1 LysR family transcriptional regulator [Corallococcus sp. NCRR]